ncbi:MAG: hypothetical protein ACI9AP_001102, partial [Flavobacteriales bacterium]
MKKFPDSLNSTRLNYRSLEATSDFHCGPYRQSFVLYELALPAIANR